MEDFLIKVEKFAKKYYKQDPEDPKLWENHVQLVRKFALKLAEIEKADKQVVEIAALLHDIGKHKGRENHNVISYELAKEFLKELNLDQNKKNLILKCILKHGSKYSSEDNEIEVKIIQSADALGVLFDEEWQKKCRRYLSREEILKKFDKMLNKKINLDSARKIATLQIKKLKRLLL